jgi:ABC-type uncharacterized transport system auxiliary subunit
MRGARRTFAQPGRNAKSTVMILLGLSALMIAACGCGGSRPIKYYQVTYPTTEVTPQDPIDAILIVRAFEAPHLYLADKIVYGFDGPEMDTYENHRWAEPPIEIMQMALVRGLRATGRFKGVYTPRASTGGEFLLNGYLYDFKEVDAKPIVARLNYEVRLRDRKSGATVWSHVYSHDEPAEHKTVNDFVVAMDKNVQRSVQEVQAGLEEYFRAHPVN